MSTRGRSSKPPRQDSFAVFVGDFAVLKDFLEEKERPFWSVFRLIDALLRGYGQVACANNPISGLLIVIALAATAPGTLISSVITGFLGLLLSVLTRNSESNVQNGLTVYNPLLVGAVSFKLVPEIYGAFDSFSVLLVLLGTIISVYLTQSMASRKSPCMLWPFNLVEIVLFFALFTRNNDSESAWGASLIAKTDNATSDATTEDVSFIGENATNVYIDWGMLFQGIVVSASRLYEVNSVAAGSVVYLAVLIFSPATACFGFLGAVVGSFAGLQLGAPPDQVYSGFWGTNCLLTGAALGGNFFILNGQTVAATFAAIVYTVLAQYSLLSLLSRVGLPVLTLPFVLASSLFLGLRNDPRDGAFVRPAATSFPEKQRRDYLASRRTVAGEMDDSEGREAQRKITFAPTADV